MTRIPTSRGCYLPLELAFTILSLLVSLIAPLPCGSKFKEWIIYQSFNLTYWAFTEFSSASLAQYFPQPLGWFSVGQGLTLPDFWKNRAESPLLRATRVSIRCAQYIFNLGLFIKIQSSARWPASALRLASQTFHPEHIIKNITRAQILPKIYSQTQNKANLF